MKRFSQSLGTIIVAVLVTAALADLLSRFISYDAISFRAWEALTRYRNFGRLGRFEPERSYYNKLAYGDLSAMGNLPALREYRTEIFTTDANGLRNGKDFPARSADVVIVGTSFSAGAGLSDEQTLSAQLSQQLGRPVYNAATVDINSERRLQQLVRHLGRPQVVIVHEYVETEAPLTPERLEPDLLRRIFESRVLEKHDRFLDVFARIKGWCSNSPLQATLVSFFKAIENDSILPNTYKNLVVQEWLVNGAPILFPPGQVSAGQSRRVVEPGEVRYWKKLTERTRRHGLRHVILLVPSKYRIYGQMTRESRGKYVPDAYLADLERALVKEELTVVNVEDTFLDAARRGLPDGHYIYWRDDTHWNASGVSIAASRLVPVVRARIDTLSATGGDG